MSGLEFLAQAAHRRNGDNPPRARRLERPDVGAVVYFGRQKLMPLSVTRQKHRRAVFALGKSQRRRGRAERRVHFALFHRAKFVRLVKARPADDSQRSAILRLFHFFRACRKGCQSTSAPPQEDPAPAVQP